MRTGALLFLLVAQHAVQGQFWCPPEARWTYRYWNPWGEDLRYEHVYLGDSLFQGYVAQHMEVSRVGIWWGEPTQTHEFTRVEGDVVYAWGIMNEPWDTLYWFGAGVGDRWWPIGHPESCPPQGMMEVLALGDTVLGGMTLSTWSIGLVDENGIAPAGGWVLMMIERLGMLPRDGAYDDCMTIFENPFFEWVCYSDIDMQFPAGSDCFLTTAGPLHHQAHAVISLDPNPGSEGFSIREMGTGPVAVEVRDVFGRLVHSRTNHIVNATIGTSTWSRGSYVVTVIEQDGTRNSIRWVKQ